MLSVPLHHASEPFAKALVHGTPLIAEFATVAPFLRWPHAVPLKVNLETGVSSVVGISARYGVRRGNGISGGRCVVKTTVWFVCNCKFDGGVGIL